MSNSLIPLDASFVTSTHRLTPPGGWRPPKFSLHLAKQFNSPVYLHKDQLPICCIENLRTHMGFYWWHPLSDIAMCQSHIDSIHGSWFYTNWILLRYQRVLTHLSIPTNP